MKDETLKCFCFNTLISYNLTKKKQKAPTMSIAESTISPPLPWQSLKYFHASQTRSEKVQSVANGLLLVTGALCYYVLTSRKMVHMPPACLYARYAVLALTARKLFSTYIGYLVYPATTKPSCSLRAKEEKAINKLKEEGYITQKITLYKSWAAYDATLIGHANTLANGKWSMHALGNGDTMEECLYSIASENRRRYGVNTLLINGPSVGSSRSFPTRYQLSAGFEAGFQFLEKKIQATHIIFEGFSLGGGMLSEAALAHEFDLKKVKYLGILNCTFSRLSAIAAAMVGRLVLPIFYLTGTELDSVVGVEKLKNLNIQHIIIQHSDEHEATDGVIKDRVSLASKLKPDPTRTFLLSPDISHDRDLPATIQAELDATIQTFLATA